MKNVIITDGTDRTDAGASDTYGIGSIMEVLT